MASTTALGVSSQMAASQYPTPTTPVRAIPRISSSVRLRLTLHVAWTPPWLATSGPGGSLQHLLDGGVAGVGEVDDDAALLHRVEGLPPEVGEAALVDAVHRGGELVVEEVGEASHPHAGLPAVKVLEAALEVLQALDREEGPGHVLTGLSCGDQAVDVRLRPDQDQGAFQSFAAARASRRGGASAAAASPTSAGCSWTIVSSVMLSVSPVLDS